MNCDFKTGLVEWAAEYDRLIAENAALREVANEARKVVERDDFIDTNCGEHNDVSALKKALGKWKQFEVHEP